MNKLLQGLKSEFNYAYTENGALTYRSTMDANVDLFYHAAAKRGQDITQLFAQAYSEDALVAVKTMFYVRDIRGGQGERELFLKSLRWLYGHRPAVFNAIVSIVPEYGRWKDVLEFVDNELVVQIVQNQLLEDIESDTGVSLLAKWMPSANASSKATRKLARRWIKALGLDEPTYRKILSALRKRIGIVERFMSSGEWGNINYSAVTSRASLIYRSAFGKHDGERYGEFLQAVKRGEAKINASTLYPYDLVQKYTRWNSSTDATVEAQWSALPNYAENDESMLIVVDVSASMNQGSPKAMDVSVGTGIYGAERNKGPFANTFITFTDQPHLIQLTAGASLLEKIREVYSAGVGYNTNIQKVFDLVLATAVKHSVPQSDMPNKIVIISDMEFDAPDYKYGKVTSYDAIKRKFAAKGYVMPTLVFWNVNSRAQQAPATATQDGVFLVSGASPSNFRWIAGAKASNPLELMLEVVHSARYAPVEEALKIARL